MSVGNVGTWACSRFNISNAHPRGEKGGGAFLAVGSLRSPLFSPLGRGQLTASAVRTGEQLSMRGCRGNTLPLSEPVGNNSLEFSPNRLGEKETYLFKA